MILSCIGMNGGTLATVTSHINSEYYTDLLDLRLLSYGMDLGGFKLIFYQDNATIHD
jgi:hypothetical protein